MQRAPRPVPTWRKCAGGCCTLLSWTPIWTIRQSLRPGEAARMNAELQGKRAAEAFREEHHLGVQPLGDLVALIEQTTGHDVAVLDAGPHEHGLTMRDPSRDAVF